MKILFYDCFSGISEDINLAAITNLGLGHEFELKIATDSRKGIFGTRVDVILKERELYTHASVHSTQQDREPHGLIPATGAGHGFDP
ncbi:MAG: hypothetical protein WBB23_02125 [Desulforhopalus sp.]